MISYGVIPVSRCGTSLTSISTPTPPRLPISLVEQVSPAAPMSWMPTSAPVFITSRQASSSSFSVNGSPTWTAGPLLFRLLVELRRRHRRAVDAVAAGLGADVVDGVADAAGRALDDVVVPGDAEAEHVDQRIAVVRLVEGDLAADRRDADAVAVAADAGDDAFEDAAVERHVGRAEAQRVQQRHRPRAHREDVANDAADAGGRALVRLDERRVVVRLDLEHRRQAVADVDGAGVLSRPLQHAAAGGRQRLQVDARALVAAVLGPHHREDAELGQVGLAAHQLADAFVLVGGDAVTFEGGLVECGHRRFVSLLT